MTVVRQTSTVGSGTLVWLLGAGGVTLATWNDGAGGRRGALIVAAGLAILVRALHLLDPPVRARLAAAVPAAALVMLASYGLIGRAPALVGTACTLLADFAVRGPSAGSSAGGAALRPAGDGSAHRPVAAPTALIVVALASATWWSAQRLVVTGVLLVLATVVLAAPIGFLGGLDQLLARAADSVGVWARHGGSAARRAHRSVTSRSSQRVRSATERLTIAAKPRPAATYGPRLRDLDGRQRAILAGLLAVATSVPVIAAVGAARSGWSPIGDDAFILSSTLNVGTRRTPLLGALSSLSTYVPGVTAWHPGPVVFYWFAPFVRMLGGTVGLLTGIVAMFGVCVAAIAAVVLRTAGFRAAVGSVAAVAVAYIAGGGGKFMYQPNNGFVVTVIPAVLFVVLGWALLAGRWSVLPWWFVSGGFVVQCALPWAPSMAAAFVVTAVLLLADRVRSQGLPPPPAAPSARTSGFIGVLAVVAGVAAGVWRSGPTGDRVVTGVSVGLAVAVVVALVPWARAIAGRVGPHHRAGRRAMWWAAAASLAIAAGPIVDAVAHRGGNVVNILEGARGFSGPKRGLGDALAETARMLLLVPRQSRSGGTTWLHATLAIAVVLVLVLLVAAGWRRTTPGARRLLAVSVALLAGAVVGVSSIPVADGFSFGHLLALAPGVAMIYFSAGLIGSAALPADRWELLPVRRIPLGIAGVAGMLGLWLMATLPVPLVASVEYSPWVFRAAPRLSSDLSDTMDRRREWSYRWVGPRSILMLTAGLAVDMTSRGYSTDVRVSPGLSEVPAFRDPGRVLVQPAWAPAPEGWRLSASYRPRSFDERQAAAAAADAADHARASDDRLTPDAVRGLRAVLCPATTFEPDLDCPEANAIDLLGDLPDWLIAVLYAESQNDVFTYELHDGPDLPPALIARVRRYFTDIPVDVYTQVPS